MVVVVRQDGGTARPTLALDRGAVVTDAAINMVSNDGEGEGMRDVGAEERLVGARNDGGSRDISYLRLIV